MTRFVGATLVSIISAAPRFSWRPVPDHLYLVGDAAIDQTSQGVRVKEEFRNNTVLYLRGTLRYVF